MAPDVRARRRWRLPARLVAHAGIAGVLVLWLAAGFVLSRVTGRVTDWFVMTDELLYERLAISVADSGFPFPRLHGDLVGTFSQLYPLLVAPAFRGGLVPESLHTAHVLNAFVMTSACIPAFLLARSVLGRNWTTFAVAALTVSVPWMTLSSFLLTEVAAYPAFLWALLGMQRATALAGPRSDLLALAGLGIAVVARVQLAVLVVALPLAILVHEAGSTAAGRPFERAAAAVRRSFARHRLLTVVYATAAAATLLLALVGRLDSVLGSYGVTAEGNLVPDGVAGAFAANLASVALALGILPFVIGAAWPLATLAGGSRAERRLHAYASVATVTLVLLAAEVASFTVRFGHWSVQERYLFYVAPLILVGLAAAIRETTWPRWSLVAPAVVVAAGFLAHPLVRLEKFNIDTPTTTLHDGIVDLFETKGSAKLGLALTTVILVLIFVQAGRRLPRSVVGPVLIAALAIALPTQTAYAFSRLFAVDGTAGRPLTVDQGAVFNWIDRTLGPDADVTMVPYPTIYADNAASVAFWWDLEFWNKSVVRSAHQDGAYYWTPSLFPKLDLRLDPRTGVAGSSPTRYVAQWASDARFRVGGKIVAFDRNTFLIDAGPEWHALWLTRGLYNDGWTRPGRPATLRIFAMPNQAGAVKRSVGVIVRGVAEQPVRHVKLSSNRGTATADVGSDGVTLTVAVCVPSGGFGDVTLAVEGQGPVSGDPSSSESLLAPREGGVQVAQVGLADEFERGC